MSKDRNPIIRLSARLLRLIIWLCIFIGFRPKVVYENKDVKKLVKKQPVIITPNHIDYKDGPTCLFLFPNSAMMIAKDWYENKLIRWITYGKAAIPIDRYGLDTSWIKDAVKMIKQGKNVIIFPEGHTTEDGEIDEFKAGFAMLSVMTNAPVVPIYITGGYHALLGRRLRIYVGDMEKLSDEGKGLNAAYLQGECNRFRNIMLDMKRRYEK